jgi:hypothetical protein
LKKNIKILMSKFAAGVSSGGSSKAGGLSIFNKKKLNANRK